MLLWNLLLLLPSLSEVSLRSSPPSLPPSLPLSIRPTMALRHERGREERKQPPLPRNSGCSLFLRGGGEDREERKAATAAASFIMGGKRSQLAPSALIFAALCFFWAREREARRAREEEEAPLPHLVLSCLVDTSLSSLSFSPSPSSLLFSREAEGRKKRRGGGGKASPPQSPSPPSCQVK